MSADNPERPRRRSWLLFPMRIVGTYARPGVRALDTDSIQRSWVWARTGVRLAATRARDDSLPIVRDANGAIDLYASAAMVCADAADQFSAGRVTPETFDEMGRLSPWTLKTIIQSQADRAAREVTVATWVGALALILSFGCLLLINRTGSALTSAVFFLLLAGYFWLRALIAVKEGRTMRVAPY